MHQSGISYGKIDFFTISNKTWCSRLKSRIRRFFTKNPNILTKIYDHVLAVASDDILGKLGINHHVSHTISRKSKYLFISGIKYLKKVKKST